MASQRIQVLFTGKLLDRISQMAEEKGISKSKVISLLVQEGLKNLDGDSLLGSQPQSLKESAWRKLDAMRSAKAAATEAVEEPPATPPSTEGLPEITLEDLELLHKLKALKAAGLL